MRIDDLEKMEKEMMKEVVRRRGLGGYNTDAESILLMSEWLFKLVGHIIEQEKQKKKQR